MKELLSVILYPTDLAVSIMLWTGVFLFVAYQVLR